MRPVPSTPLLLVLLGGLLACGDAPDGAVSEPTVTESSPPSRTTVSPEPSLPPPPPEPALPPPPELLPEPAPPTYAATSSPLPEAMRAKMVGVTWEEGCPVHLDELALLELSHWDYAGEVQTGQLIVAARYAEELKAVFGKLFEAKFPIARMRPAHEHGGDDNAIMAANGTSAFNCRKKTGGSSFSEHSYGHAIDINTIQNPYVRGSRVLPPAGKDYLERNASVPGLITAGDPVVTAFAEIGWKWGGNWRSLKDYQHFSATGR